MKIPGEWVEVSVRMGGVEAGIGAATLEGVAARSGCLCFLPVEERYPVRWYSE